MHCTHPKAVYLYNYGGGTDNTPLFRQLLSANTLKLATSVNMQHAFLKCSCPGATFSAVRLAPINVLSAQRHSLQIRRKRQHSTAHPERLHSRVHSMTDGEHVNIPSPAPQAMYHISHIHAPAPAGGIDIQQYQDPFIHVLWRRHHRSEC